MNPRHEYTASTNLNRIFCRFRCFSLHIFEFFTSNLTNYHTIARMSCHETCNGRNLSPQTQTLVAHLSTADTNRNLSRSPSPISPTSTSPSSATSSFNSASSSSSPVNSEPLQRPESPVFTGLSASNVNFKDWSTIMLTKLTEMTEAKVDEKTKMEYVVAHTGREAFQKLLDRFEEMKGKGVAFGSAKPMVMFLAQYYDENVRTLDIRFSTW